MYCEVSPPSPDSGRRLAHCLELTMLSFSDRGIDVSVNSSMVVNCPTISVVTSLPCF